MYRENRFDITLVDLLLPSLAEFVFIIEIHSKTLRLSTLFLTLLCSSLCLALSLTTQRETSPPTPHRHRKGRLARALSSPKGFPISTPKWRSAA
eukprot:c14894_g1_i2 orf=84-365(-)